ncbi:J domain-containing protein [Novilysobacter antarcticus]|uniref:J domain-containing protein n=1 Tax=Novilysobacter antarcticus TaxID=2862543 RepID=UPI001C995ECA|nr:J domain-containing protein [Lysobacter antarcticus]
MNCDTDFLQLYRQLRIQPGCSLPAFKQAYRRRVRELHPDRMSGAQDSSERLKELNLDYAAALAFHRHYGRLPGAVPESRARFSPPPPRSERTVQIRRRPRSSIPYDPPNRWLLLVFSLVAVIPLYTLLPSQGIDATRTAPEASVAFGNPAGIAPTFIELGMEPDSVSALLGPPVINADDAEHWFYGPSWIRFECGEVVEWHSSVLRPLPVADSRRASLTRDRPPERRARRCTAKPRRASSSRPADALVAPRSGVA